MNTQVESKQTAAHWQNVSDIYTFLSMSMRSPSSETLDETYFDAFEEMLASLDLEEERKLIQQRRSNGPDFLNSLQQEYVRLSESDDKAKNLPLYASAYPLQDENSEHKSKHDLLKFQRAQGYALNATDSPADHIKYELEFLAILNKEGKEDAEREFRLGYFRPWFERLLEEAQGKVTHPFYQISLGLIDFCTQEDN